MVYISSPPRVYANGLDNPINEVIVKQGSLMIGNAILSVPIGEWEYQLTILALFKEVLVIVDDVQFVEYTIVGL